LQVTPRACKVTKWNSHTLFTQLHS
jgi:hypothetical protein